ncbi:MAG: hypothetical protein KJI71_04675 [Patescibacteria group bacterium]|nr:hypothetical protein [Patescibacteria group bacterium]
MVNNCEGSLRTYPLDTRFVKKRHMGTLFVDDKIVFMFNNGDKVDVKFDDIDSIKIDKVMGGFKVIRIFLKDKKAFQFCSSGSSNWSATTSMLAGHNLMAIGSQIDNKNRINAVNESVYNTIKYMIDKTNTN